jgi:hypothetical protein
VEPSARCRGRQNASVSPMLPFLDFDLSALLQQVISRNFPNLETSVSVSFFKAVLSLTEPLASVVVRDRTAIIRVHEILNRNDTPRETIEFILVHEMLHIVIPPREIDGRTVHHPPEFWDAESGLYPTRFQIWDWLHRALFPWLKSDEKRERTLVLRGWNKGARHPFPTLGEVPANADVDRSKSARLLSRGLGAFLCAQ